MRSQKFYRKNEKDVMKKLGLRPVPMSGAGWVSKEDGEDDFVLCQLKSTDASSFRVSRVDLDKLEYHALVSHKIPIFATNFLEDGKLYITLSVDKIDAFIDYWKDNKSLSDVKSGPLINVSETENVAASSKKVVKSGNREKYHSMREKELGERYGKKK